MSYLIRTLLSLLLATSACAYEFTSNEALIRDIAQIAPEPTEKELDLVQFIRANAASLPRFADQDDLNRRMGITIQYHDAMNRAFQKRMGAAAKGNVQAKVYPVYLVAAFWCMAKAQPDLNTFMSQFRRDDPTYQVRVDGFRGMQMNFLAMLQGMALMIGDPALEDDEKVLMLSNALKFIHYYKKSIGKDVIKSQGEVFRRYDVSDQSAETQRLFKEMHVAIVNW